MYSRILIPLDGSPVAEQVLPLAKMFAAHLKSAVILVKVIEPLGKRLPADAAHLHPDEQVGSWRTQALEYLKTIQRDFPAGIRVECEVRVGSPASEILGLAETAPADLIAMATHGRTGPQRWVYGSVAAKVLSGTHLPVLLVRARESPHASAPIKRILVTLDGSELAERALAPAKNVAQAFDAEIVLFQVREMIAYGVDSPSAGMYAGAVEDAIREITEQYLTQTAQRLGGEGLHVRWESQAGLVTERILEEAQALGANLIVMSTHGRSGLGRWVMGSDAERVLSASQIPVLLVRAGGKA